MNYRQAQSTPLKRGMKWYVVYMPDKEDEFIQSNSHNDAEIRANIEYPTNLGVAYTEL